MIKNIQTLRFLAALLVVFHHMHFPWIPSAIKTMGFAGVDIFFAISGFIMAETTREIKSGPKHSFSFLIKRFIRIYSGWWPFFFAYLFLNIYSRGMNPQASIWGSFFLVPQDMMKNIEGITWTLSFELYFYTLIALLIAFFNKNRTLIITLLALAILCLNIYYYINGLYFPENEAIAKKNLLIPFYTSPLLLEFFAGFLLADFLQKKPAGILWPWIAISLTGICVAYHTQITQDMQLAGFFLACERVAIYGSISISLLAIAVQLEKRNIKPLRRIQQLGDASYSIYLIHPLIIYGMFHAFGNFNLQKFINYNWWMLACFALILLLSTINYKLIERPLNRILLKAVMGSRHRGSAD